MDDLQAQLGAIMSNPEMMGKLMSFAQNLGISPESLSPPAAPQPQSPPPSPMPSLPPDIPDLSMLQALSGLAGQSHIDQKQKNLLNALGPYLSGGRIQRLEKAMRAAKMAGLAGKFLFPSPGR